MKLALIKSPINRTATILGFLSSLQDIGYKLRDFRRKIKGRTVDKILLINTLIV